MKFIIIAAILSAKAARGQDITDSVPADLADRCFGDFYTSLIKGINCTEGSLQCKYNSLQFCSDSQEALNCARDIVDGDGLEKDGRNNFDSWMEAITLVHEYLCLHNPDIVRDFLTGMKTDRGCWDPWAFSRCVEEKTTITHVVDLLHVVMDRVECNWVVMGLAVCNSLSLQSNETFCVKVSNNIYEIIHIFMQKSNCGSGSEFSSGIALKLNLLFFYSCLSIVTSVYIMKCVTK